MSEYTPNTEHVRDAYVRAMRNAFIASAGEHEAEFDRWLERVRAEERERLIATVEALHRPRTIQVLTGDCAAGECEHEGLADCPLTPFEQCVECDRIADEVSTYYSESGVSVSAWPCPTVAAIRAVSEQEEHHG